MNKILQRAQTSTLVYQYISNYTDVYKHILFGESLTQLKLRNGTVISSPPAGVNIWTHFNDIWLKSSYTRNARTLEGGIVIDVGADIGLFTLLAAKSAKHVYSFEPFPPIYKCLTKNISQNNLHNVTCSSMAVAGEKGERTFQLSTEATANSLYVPADDETHEQIHVTCTTISDVFDCANIDICHFLKLDCEGAEFEILLNTPESYLQRIRTLVIECHNDLTKYTDRDLQERLEKNGFDVIIYGRRPRTAMLHAENRRL